MIWQGWVRFGQPVDDRHGGVFGQFEQHVLLEGADHDQVDVARQHAGGVGDGLAVAELHLGARQHHGLPAHLPHAHVEGDAGAGGGFLEDQRDHVVLERLLVVGRALGAAVAGRFHRRALSMMA
jgi:hypothetical protein